MYKVLGMDDPLVVVFDQYASRIRAHLHLRATASRFVLFQPHREEHKDCVGVDVEKHTDLRILDQEHDWWSVFLPSWGQAWVHDRDIVVSRVADTTGTSRHRIKTVKIVSNTLQWNDLENLLKSVGSTVQHLHIVIKRIGDHLVPPLEAPTPDIALDYPSLHKVHIQLVDVNQLDILVDAFDMLSYLHTLDQLDMEITRVLTRLPVRFIDALCESTHVLAKCLMTLTVDIAYRSDPTTRMIADQFVRVLQQNQRLSVLHMRNMWDRSNSVSALTAYDGMILPSQLPMSEKLAFLSVITGNETVTMPLHLLDSAVIIFIFQFAAPACKREIRLLDQHRFRW